MQGRLHLACEIGARWPELTCPSGAEVLGRGKGTRKKEGMREYGKRKGEDLFQRSDAPEREM